MASDPFLPFVQVPPIDRTAGQAMGKMIGEMTMASRERLAAMNVATVAKHYGVSEAAVERERNWQLGR